MRRCRTSMSPSRPEIDSLFTGAAATWATRYQKRPSLLARYTVVGRVVRDELVARASSRASPPRVLDFGSGPGVFAAVASDFARIVVCLDRSEAMLRSGQRDGETLSRLAQLLGGTYRPDRIERILGDERTLIGLRDESFEFILAVAVLEYVPSPKGTLRELLRCLTPDGVLFVMTPNPRSLLRRIEPPINAAASWLGSRLEIPRLAERACTGGGNNLRNLDIPLYVSSIGGIVDSVIPIPLMLDGGGRRLRPNSLLRISRVPRKRSTSADDAGI